MKIQIFGMDGFIGQHFAFHCQNFGSNPIKGEIQSEKMMKSERPDVIVHLAGSSLVKYRTNEQLSFQRDYQTTKLLCDWSLEMATPMIYISSASVYPLLSEPVSEAESPAPVLAVGHSKVKQEKLVNEYRDRHGLKAIILRPFNVYGPRQRPPMVIPMFLEMAARGEIKIQEPRSVRDFIHVNDVCSALFQACQRLSRHKDDSSTGELDVIFNLGTGFGTTMEVLGTLISDLWRETWRKSPRIIMNSGTTATTSIADISRSSRVLDWKPTIKLSNGLREMIQTDSGTKH